MIRLRSSRQAFFGRDGVAGVFYLSEYILSGGMFVSLLIVVWIICFVLFFNLLNGRNRRF